eukprot:CAMPEP_0177756894 /NCGR_PEP_ID=MMETSP0491_2-20121128/3355_1 /TAXON_ID=63592 /ORGANISM="Tetraselmis chuii, Strain PLY429" /LENGTH=1404 /DNA_ID=CAMNT_0019272513 /DNA_START=626 /DNA_END=4840 /DNA_ORIENTATION=-
MSSQDAADNIRAAAPSRTTTSHPIPSALQQSHRVIADEVEPSNIEVTLETCSHAAEQVGPGVSTSAELPDEHASVIFVKSIAKGVRRYLNLTSSSISSALPFSRTQACDDASSDDAGPIGTSVDDVEQSGVKPAPSRRKREGGHDSSKGEEGARLCRAPSFANPQWQPASGSMAMAVINNLEPVDEDESIVDKPRIPSPRMSASGRVVAFFRSNKVHIWSVDIQQERLELDLSQWGGWPLAAVFTVDGQILIVSTKLGAVTAWNVYTGKLVAELREAKMTDNAPENTSWPGTHHLRTAPGLLVWSGHNRGHLCVWDTNEWEARPFELGVPKNHLGRIISWQVSGNGDKVAALMFDAGESQDNNSDARKPLERQEGQGTIKVWSLVDGDEVFSLVLGRCPQQAWFAKDMSRVALWFSDNSFGTSVVGDSRQHSVTSPLSTLRSGKLSRFWTNTCLGPISRNALSNDAETERHTTAALPTRCVAVWSLRRDGGEIEVVHTDIPTKHVHCTFTTQGHRLAIQHEDFVSLWDMEQRMQVAVLRGSGTAVFSPDDRFLACWEPQRPVVVLWNVEAGTRLYELSIDGVEALPGSAIGRLGEQNGERQAQKLAKIEFTADSTQLLTALVADDTVVLWNIAPGAAYHKVTGRFGFNVTRNGNMSSPSDAFLGATPDAARAVVSRNHGRKLEFWNLQTNVRLDSVDHTSSIVDMKFSDDGAMAFGAASDASFHSWNLRTGKMEVSHGCRERGEPAVEGARRSCRTDVIACTCIRKGLGAQVLDNVLKLIRVEDGHCLHAMSLDLPGLRGHLSEPPTLAFASEGSRVISAASDGTVIAWDTATGRPAFTVAQVALHTSTSWTAPAAMSPGDLSAGVAEVAMNCSGSDRVLLHAKSISVSPSGRSLALLRFSFPSRGAVEGGQCSSPQSTDVGGAPSADTAAASFPGGGNTAESRLLRRRLPLSLYTHYTEDPPVDLKCLTVLCTNSGAEQHSRSAEEIREQVPIYYRTAFQPTMCCWSADSTCLALYGCTYGTPAALVFELGSSVGQARCRPMINHGSNKTWSFSSVALSSNGSRMVATGEAPAIRIPAMTNTMRSHVEQCPSAYTMPIQVWNTLDGVIMYTFNHHTGSMIDLSFSSNDCQIVAASTSGIYTFTMAAVEGMDPDPHQLMECVRTGDLSNFDSPAGYRDIAALLKAYPMLPNKLDAEGRNLITLAAQGNQEGLMQSILSCPHATGYGLKGALGSDINAMAAALQQSPACVSLLLKALTAGHLRPQSSAISISEVWRDLLKSFTDEFVEYLGSRGVSDVGACLISSKVGDLKEGILSIASPYFTVSCPRTLWQGLVKEKESGVPHTPLNSELEIPVMARAVTIPGCCLPGRNGLLSALLNHSTVPTVAWGLPIVQAVIAFKVHRPV